MRAMASDEELLLLLKTAGPLTAGELAARLGLAPQGLRRRLEALAAAGQIQAVTERAGVGRPRKRWRLAPAGEARFPDGHDILATELIADIRAELGEAALDRLIGRRERAQEARYRAALSGRRGLKARAGELARLRSAEGYMAELREDAAGLLLVEHHCPICAAAAACQGFCRSELAVFRAVLGPGVSVERESHILAGAPRCVYRIGSLNKKKPSPRARGEGWVRGRETGAEES